MAAEVENSKPTKTQKFSAQGLVWDEMLNKDLLDSNNLIWILKTYYLRNFEQSTFDFSFQKNMNRLEIPNWHFLNWNSQEKHYNLRYFLG